MAEEMKRNESGDPVQPGTPPRVSRSIRNESGDRMDGRVDPPSFSAPSPAPPRSLPPGAVGLNESGDPMFPKARIGRNDAGDRLPGTSTAVQQVDRPKPPCAKCGGAGKKPYRDDRGFQSSMACQDCGGTGLES